MTEIKANYPQRHLELTLTATDGATDVTNDFLLTYSIIDLPEPERKAIRMAVDALLDAKNRHRDFPSLPAEGLSIIGEEFGEACKAYNESDRKGLVKEISHTVATCLRLIAERVKAGE